MEIRVYDSLNKRVGRNIMVAVVAGLLAAFGTFRLTSPEGTGFPPEAYPVLVVAALIILVMFAVINVTTSRQIRIERATGEVFRLDFLLGREVRRQRFNLSDFDRVTLSRGFRAGYRVSLVGREQDLAVLLTATLETARDQADKVAAECGLKVTDQL